MTTDALPPCPVCGGACALHDVVDFNKSCEEARGIFLPVLGVPIYYALCGQCGFCFSPDLYRWSLKDFADHIYNDDYVLVDPDYAQVRPAGNAALIASTFGAHKGDIRHLDYGGGSGLMSGLLAAQGFTSRSYDPFVNTDTDPHGIGAFDLITAFEVFEHVPDVNALMIDLGVLLAPGGVILFSTLASDGQIARHRRLDWWYASPRNGHISLFSKASLGALAQKFGFNFGSFNDGLHAMWTTPPAWAGTLLG